MTVAGEGEDALIETRRLKILWRLADPEGWEVVVVVFRINRVDDIPGVEVRVLRIISEEDIYVGGWNERLILVGIFMVEMYESYVEHGFSNGG